MADIGQELLEAIEQDYQRLIKENEELQKLMKKIGKKHPSYEDVLEYADVLGECLSNAIKNNVNGSVLPDGKMYYNIAKTILEPMLRENYEKVIEQCVICQNNLNANAKLGLKAVRAKYNEERTEGIVKYISGAEAYTDREKSFLQAIVTNSRNVVFDSVKENADFHYQSGLHPKIIRRANSGACKWCLALVGTYNYEDVKNTGNDVFRKHNNCKCSVVYDPADGSKKVQDVYSKTWQDETAIEERKQFSLASRTKSDTIIHSKGYITKGIEEGTIKDEVNVNKQARHCYDSEDYIEGRSYLYGTVDDATELYNKYKTTGVPVIDRKGNWKNKERVLCDDIIGETIDKNGNSAESKTLMIIYSKTGSHMYPIKG